MGTRSEFPGFIDNGWNDSLVRFAFAIQLPLVYFTGRKIANFFISFLEFCT